MSQRPPPRPSRRALLSGAAAWAGCSLTGGLPPPPQPVPVAPPAPPPAAPSPPRPTPALPPGLFSLGVASGDPAPDGFVLWTRLAPDPLNGGGMPPEPVPVRWQVATDERMTAVVRAGEAMATPAFAHSVHVEVEGLPPDRWYWYRFRAGNEASPIGRTRTAPAARAPVERLSFAATSCLDWQAGYYTGFLHLVGEDLDFVVHLGDYIYEGGIDPQGVRAHNAPRVKSLDDYRNRYALYKTDLLLQAAHAAFPWMVIWDDHEVADNYAGRFEIIGEDAARFALRRTAAYQAFYEHQPLRSSARPSGPDMLLYRQLSFGDLLDVHLLDTRQYRNLPPNRVQWEPRLLPDMMEPEAVSMLGARQEAWLRSGLRSSTARWNALAQGIFLAQRLSAPTESGLRLTNHDKWDGYPRARRRLTSLLAERPPANPVVLTGDDHRTWISDIKENYEDPRSRTVATELVGPAISSSGDGQEVSPGAPSLLANNPHLKYHHGLRGYLRVQLDHHTWRTDVRVMPYVSRPGAALFTAASFGIQAGRPGTERLG
jgi:alkaline phosphatase D